MRERWSQLDVFGIALSGLCFVHCLLTPILLTSLPFLFTGTAEIVSTSVMVLGASLAIVHGYFHHGRVTPFVIYMLGIIVFFSGKMLDGRIYSAELLGALAMSACFITAHALNYRFCRISSHAAA